MNQSESSPSAQMYSPDGRWWWDGREWRPVLGASGLRPAPRGTGGRWLLAAVIVMVVASSLVLALGAAVIAVRLIHSPAFRSAPPFQSYLRDTSVAGVEAAARSHGLQCGTAVSVGAPVHTCQRVTRGEVMSVHMIGSDSTHVAVVSADVLSLRPEDRPVALDLFQAIVGAVVVGPDSSTAAEWLSAHFDKAGFSQTTVDGVTFGLSVTGSNRSLSLHPAAP